jgi:hypothetical protein
MHKKFMMLFSKKNQLLFIKKINRLLVAIGFFVALSWQMCYNLLSNGDVLDSTGIGRA